MDSRSKKAPHAVIVPGSKDHDRPDRREAEAADADKFK